MKNKMGNWQSNAKYANEFKKATTLNLPRGLERRKFELRWMLAFERITFDEFEEKMKKLKEESNDN